MTTTYDVTAFPSAGRAVQLLLGEAPEGYENPLAHVLSRHPERALQLYDDAVPGEFRGGPRVDTYRLFHLPPHALDGPQAWAVLIHTPEATRFGDHWSVDVVGSALRAHRRWFHLTAQGVRS